MFTIIGGDGKEYGPVSAETLKEWITQGRVAPDTRARRDGTPEWRTLREFPEFAGAGGGVLPLAGGAPAGAAAGFGAAAGDGGSAIGSRNVDPKAYAEAIIARGIKLDLGELLGAGFNLYKQNFAALFVPALIFLILAGISAAVPFLGFLISLAITGPLLAGVQLIFLRRLRGEAVEVGQLFQYFSIAFVPLLLAYVVSTLLTAVGLLLLILPGIYLMVSYAFVYFLVVEHKLAFWDAMEVSRRVVTNQWFMFFLVLFVAYLLAILGMIALVIGILVTLPLFFAVLAATYEKVIGRPVA